MFIKCSDFSNRGALRKKMRIHCELVEFSAGFQGFAGPAALVLKGRSGKTIGNARALTL
jgi:hypothetical protein